MNIFYQFTLLFYFIIFLHLFSFKTPILLGKKNKKKCKINSKELHLTIA
jgi:hypothetical protein